MRYLLDIQYILSKKSCDPKNDKTLQPNQTLCNPVTSQSTHLIVLQAADHELSEDDHSSATHPGTTVNHHRWIEAL